MNELQKSIVSRIFQLIRANKNNTIVAAKGHITARMIGCHPNTLKAIARKDNRFTYHPDTKTITLQDWQGSIEEKPPLTPIANPGDSVSIDGTIRKIERVIKVRTFQNGKNVLVWKYLYRVGGNWKQVLEHRLHS